MPESNSTFSSSVLSAAAAAFGGALIGGAVAVAVLRGRNSSASLIERYGVKARAAAAVKHQNVVYLSGQVGIIEKLEESDVQAQTRQTLNKIDGLLAECGTSKKNILSAQIWLKDIKRDFAAMNEVWNEYVEGDEKGVRACVEAEMAREHILVEIKVIAAVL